MSEFTKQDWALINDLCNVAWAAGAVKNPQMGGAIEQLRQKVAAKLEPPPQNGRPEVVKAARDGGK